LAPACCREFQHREEGEGEAPRKCLVRAAKFLGMGASITIMLLAAGDFGKVGLSQGADPTCAHPGVWWCRIGRVLT
jgi:hypothetical protein